MKDERSLSLRNTKDHETTTNNYTTTNWKIQKK